MPNPLTHYTFASLLSKDFFLHKQAVYVGAQGPDPFFFYGTLPVWGRPNKKQVNSLGGVSQHLEPTKIYQAMIEYALSSQDRDLLFSYIDGLFMHYAVDRACHPYIFYFTGFTDRPGDSKQVQHHYNYSHMCLEVILDYLISHKEGSFQRVEKVLQLDKEEALAISKMWYEVNKRVQQVPSIKEDSFYKSLLDYRHVERLAYDPHGGKKKLFGLLFGKESLPYGLPFPTSLDRFQGIDFLNESHRLWRMPNGEKRHDSFYDLYLGEAKDIYLGLHECLLKDKQGKNQDKQMALIINHINHEGIVPDSPKIYWKLIWPKDFLVDLIEPPEE